MASDHPGPGTYPLDKDAVAIWQAEGAVMELLGVSALTAGQCLRLLARRHGQTVVDIAATIIENRRIPG